MTVRDTVDSLGALSRKWLRRNFAHRQRAVSRLVRRSGFSQKMAESMLDALFSELTAPKLHRLLQTELRDPAALDGFVEDARNGRLVRARGPQTILHVFSANIPNAAVVSFVRGLLLKSRNVGKLSGRDAGMLELWLGSLRVHDRGLWERCVLVRSRNAAAEWAKRAQLVLAYGQDESLTEIRKWVPAKTRFIGYGHRVSIALVLREALRGNNAAPLARRTAHDVWMADQRGCLSPVIVFVQKGGGVHAGRFAELLADGLARLEKSERSRPRRTQRHWVSLRRFQDRMKLTALQARNVRTWQGEHGLWMVGYDEDPANGPGPSAGFFGTGSQLIRVRGFRRLRDLEATLQSMSASLQAASLECASAQRKKIAEWLGSFGVNRICRAGKLQRPPIGWHQDGRLNLADWLTWTGLEAR